MKAIDFIKTKKPGWYVSAASLILAFVTLIIYAARGGNLYSSVEGRVVALLILGIVAGAAVLIKDFKVGAFVPLVFYAVALGVLLNTEMLFISNVMTGIDNNYFDPAFICFFVTLIISLVGAVAASIMKLSKN